MNKQQYVIGMIVLIIFLGIGFFIGRQSKHCPKVISHMVKSDTEIKQTPIVNSPVVTTHPVNHTIPSTKTNTTKEDNAKSTNPKIIYVHDNSSIESDSCEMFYTNDTLRWEGIYVAISDTGNCHGIMNRKHQFGGNLQERIITNTITNTTERPIPFFQFNAGVQTYFDNRFRFYDIAPIAQIEIRHRLYAGYSYMLNSRSHNVSLLTKIK